MEDRIVALDDGTAMGILQAMTEGIQGKNRFEEEITPEIRELLEAEYQLTGTVGEFHTGEMARATLLLLSQDEESREKIAELLARDGTRAIGLAGVAVVACALVALQTHVRFEKDKDGRTSILIELKPTKEAILKPVVEQLLSFVSGGIFGPR